MSALPAEYVLDSTVNLALDQKLRDILSTCFTKPGDTVFRDRRYWRELPQHRWVIRATTGEIIAHIAVHEKIVVFGGKKHRIGGIAEVCVRPEHRGHGYVKVLLAHAHDWLRAYGFAFAVLFGEPHVYSSSGYVVVTNLVADIRDAAGEVRRQPAKGAMVVSLGRQSWPATEVFLPGQIF